MELPAPHPAGISGFGIPRARITPGHTRDGDLSWRMRRKKNGAPGSQPGKLGFPREKRTAKSELELEKSQQDPKGLERSQKKRTRMGKKALEEENSWDERKPQERTKRQNSSEVNSSQSWKPNFPFPPSLYPSFPMEKENMEYPSSHSIPSPGKAKLSSQIPNQTLMKF